MFPTILFQNLRILHEFTKTLFLGDIFATSEGERVVSVCFRWTLLPKRVSENEYPGFLYLSFPLCGLAFRNYHRSNQRNSGGSHYKKEGFRQDAGVLSRLNTTVLGENCNCGLLCACFWHWCCSKTCPGWISIPFFRSENGKGSSLWLTMKLNRSGAVIICQIKIGL